jgi:5-methyltetrahydropteroyltriglutamate--homocysteine methyltransferase
MSIIRMVRNVKADHPGSDCGFGTWVGQAAVDPDVVWAKFAAMAEGARIASKRFWS